MASFFNNRIHAIDAEIISDIEDVIGYVKGITRGGEPLNLAAYRIKKYLDAYMKAENDESQKSDIIDKLTHAQEDILKEAHAKDYHGTDDDMPDAYEAWIENLTLEELKSFLGL